MYCNNFKNLEQLSQMMAQTGGSPKGCTSNYSSYRAESKLERLQHISPLKGETDGLGKGTQDLSANLLSAYVFLL